MEQQNNRKLFNESDAQFIEELERMVMALFLTREFILSGDLIDYYKKIRCSVELMGYLVFDTIVVHYEKDETTLRIRTSGEDYTRIFENYVVVRSDIHTLIGSCLRSTTKQIIIDLFHTRGLDLSDEDLANIEKLNTKESEYLPNLGWFFSVDEFSVFIDESGGLTIRNSEFTRYFKGNERSPLFRNNVHPDELSFLERESHEYWLNIMGRIKD